MAVNIGPKIGIDGEKEYRKQLNDLITTQKTFSSELRELESDFNSNASAMDKNRRKGELLEKSIKNQEKQVEELEKGLEASKKKYGENSTQTQKWKQAVNNAKTELNKMRSELSKIPKPLAEVGKAMQSAGKKMQKVGDSMSKYVTAPIVAVGAASIAAFQEVDDGLDSIAKTTGATGTALEELETAAKNIATTIPTTFEDAGNAVGTVNTKFGLTGKACEDLSTKFIKFAKINDQDVSTSIEGTQKVMAAFGLEAEDADDLLDAMNKTGQKTGVSMDTLQTSMVKNAAALQGMGLDAYQAAGFLGEVETSGADTSVVMAGLAKALVNANEEGKTLPEALGEFQTLMNSTATDQEKLNAAIDLFGKKAGPAIYQACAQGSLSFESLSTDASEYLGSVEETFNNVIDPVDEFQVTMNSLKLLGAEVGKSLLTAAAPAIETLGNKLKSAAEWFDSLDESQKSFALTAAVALAAGGPVLSGLGRLTESLGKVVEAAGNMTGVSGFITSAVSNPVALAVIAVGGLIGAFNLLDKSSGYLNEEIQGVVTGTNSAITAMKSATAQLSQTLATAESELGDINGTADLADGLITELAGLENQSKLTAIEQGRMRTIVGELNAMYPEFGIQIDSSTGKLSMSTAEMKNYVEQARKMKLIEAFQKAATKGYEDLAEAHIALDTAQKQQSANQEVINGLLEEQARLYGLVEDGNGNLVDSNGEFVMSASEYDAALSTVALDLQLAEENQKKLDTATQDAQTTYDDAATAIASYEQAANDAATELEQLGNTATKTGKTAETSAKNAGKTLETTATNSSKTASNTIETTIGAANPKPTVQKVEVPHTVTDLAKQIITNNVNNVHGKVTKVDGGAAAGKAAKSDIEGKIDNMSGKVTSVSVSANALSNVKSSISNFLQNNPVTAWIKANVNAEKHAEGGFTYKEQLSWLSEGNQPEVVIPLSTAKRDRAMTLYQETGQILGVATPNVQTMTVPDNSTSSGSIKVKFDTERMYAAVAAGAKQGMESADIKIYIDNREAGRILKGMGVAFA